MPFDPNYYAYLAQSDPNAAAAYLASNAPQAPAAAPQPQLPQPGPSFFSNPGALAAQPQVAARGTLEDFFNQSSGTGGGPSVTSKFFNQRQQGSWLQLEVISDVTNADVVHQKEPGGKLQYYKRNGQDDLTRPKLVLVVKVRVTGSSDGSHTSVFPDGEATIWLKPGDMASALQAAMAAAGDPSGYPKGGAQMVMQSAGTKPSRTAGYSDTKLYSFQYAGPQRDLQAAAQAASGFANPAGYLAESTAQRSGYADVPANPTTQIPSATAPVPSPAQVTPAAPATAAPVLSVPSAPAGPAPSPSLATVTAPPTTPTAPAPAPNFQAPDKDALLARLHGNG